MTLADGDLRGAAASGSFLILFGLVRFGEVRSDIAGIDLDDVGRYERSLFRVPMVISRTHRGEEIKLNEFLNGSVRLFDSLSAAWAQGKAVAEGPPGPPR